MHLKVSEKEEKNTPYANPYTTAAGIIYLINDVEKPRLGNAGLIGDQRYRTNHDAGLTFSPVFRQSGIYLYRPGPPGFLIACLLS